MYPFVGKSVLIDYTDIKYLLSFRDSKKLDLESKVEDSVFKESVDYKVVEVSKNIYFLYWFEPKGKIFVSQVQNLNCGRVCSNILDLKTSEFYHLKGKIYLYNDSKTKNCKNSNQNNKPTCPPPPVPNKCSANAVQNKCTSNPVVISCPPGCSK